jgi:hypothetical protein
MVKRAKFREIKPEIRIIGIDDGSFVPHTKGKALVVGAVFRGGKWLDGVLRTYVDIDGTDATKRIVDMVNASRHKGQIRVIMIEGLTFAGFNVVDIKRIFKETGLPVIALNRKRPDFLKVKRALQHLPRWQQRWKVLQSAGRIHPVSPKRYKSSVYMQIVGITRSDAEKLVKLTSTRSLLPEPLRVAHLIATGIVRGESVGRV